MVETGTINHWVATHHDSHGFAIAAMIGHPEVRTLNPAISLLRSTITEAPGLHQYLEGI